MLTAAVLPSPVISNVLVNEDFITRFSLSPWDQGLLTSILELFALVGSLLSSYLLVPLSPHRTLIVFALIFLVGSSMQTAANSTAILTVGRAIGGVGIGGMSTVTPLYCADVSATEVRGSILCLEQMSIVLGVVFGFWVGWATRSGAFDLLSPRLLPSPKTDPTPLLLGSERKCLLATTSSLPDAAGRYSPRCALHHFSYVSSVAGRPEGRGEASRGSEGARQVASEGSRLAGSRGGVRLFHSVLDSM